MAPDLSPHVIYTAQITDPTGAVIDEETVAYDIWPDGTHEDQQDCWLCDRPIFSHDRHLCWEKRMRRGEGYDV